MKRNNTTEMSDTELVAKNIALQENIKKMMEEAYALSRMLSRPRGKRR